MNRTFEFALIILQIVTFVRAKGYYTIVAPGTIQPNYRYSVSVTLHENDGPASIKVGISGPTYNESKTVDLTPLQTEVIHFDVPKLKDARHILETEGVKGIIFKNSTELIFSNKKPKIYIQTDKAVYKPGDLVQFRILVLDENTRPAKLEEPLRLGFKDGAGNFIKEVKDIKLNKGVYSDEFQLSDEPVLGRWVIQAYPDPNDEDIKLEKNFEVAKYVLPKFSVDIETARDIAFDEGTLKITIRSKYTYDKPVKGQATITVDTKHGQVKSEKVIDMLGKGHVEFDLVKDLQLELPEENDKYGHYTYTYIPPINILAVMTEEQTGNKRNKTALVNLHRSRYNIEVPNNVYEFIAKKPFELKAFVKNLDGSPVQNNKQMVKLLIGKNEKSFNNDKTNDKFEFTTELDKNGMALFKVTLPTADYYSNIKIMYADKVHYMPAMTGKESDDKDNNGDNDDDVGPLKLVLKTDNLQLGHDVVVEVKSNKNMPYYVYAIIARGNIIKQEHVKLPENVKSHEIKFKPTFNMVPESYLYVYFVVEGDLKFDELVFHFPKEFENKIEIMAPKQAKPSEEIALNIKTDPDSFVGLLGVDQSVLLLQSGNDLDSKQIMNDLSGYNTRTPHIRGFGKYPGQTSGLVTLTNANYPYTTAHGKIKKKFMKEDTRYRGHTLITSIGFQQSLSEDQVEGPSEILKYLPIRQYFIESWIYTNIEKLYSIEWPRTDIMYRMHTTTRYQGMGSGVRQELHGITFDAPDGPAGRDIQPTLRKEFIENWIFFDLKNTDKNGLISLTKKIPDTITSWVVTGFSMNEKTGFGMVENPTKIEVFQPFFLSTNLPYSVKRGEVISIPVVVFNYMEKALDTEVTMENTDNEYDFTEVSNEVEELVLQDKQRIKKVTVPSYEGKSVSFMIRPNKVGEITLKIKAVSPLAGDAIHQKLKVEPEGVTHYENEAIFIAASDKKGKETLKAVIPQDAVLDSEYLEFSVVGDLLGPTIKNIDQLVRQPYGCGEQNMVNFVPNILVLNYLEAIKKDTSSVLKKAKGFLEIGYQRQLTYKHQNGAYSAFGEGSSEPNSWLTAYVARYFIQAKKYISTDPVVINQALEYLVSNQLENGQFKQTGRLFHPSHQNDVGFTAFSLLALLEDKEYSNKYRAEIEKGVKYLVDSLDKESDTYALAIAALALKKVDSPAFSKLMPKLEDLAHQENGLKWWTKSTKDHSNDIEITAYILEAYAYTEPAGKLIPIIKWLISKRNSNGGFESTQDTVVGLQALIKFAEKHVDGGSGKMSITFEAQDNQGKETTKGSFSVDKENSLLLQTHVLPKSSRQITLQAEGEGSSLLQLSYRYNLATKDDKPSFTVNHKILPSTYHGQLLMEICANYVPTTGDNIKESNMAVMEIYLPSGFTADSERFDDIRQTKQVQRIETKNSDTALIIYFDYLETGKEVCFNVAAEKSHAVAKQKPAAITIYDYYKMDQRATVYYEVKSSLCDICEKGECGKCEN